MAELNLEEVQALVRHFLAGSGSPKELAELHQALAEDSAVALELVAQVQEAFENRPPAKLTPLQLAQVQVRVDALLIPLIRYTGLKGRLKKLLGKTKAATREGYVEPKVAEPAQVEQPAPAPEAPAAEPQAEAPALAEDQPAADPPVLAEAGPEPAAPVPAAEVGSEPEPEPGIPEPAVAPPRSLDLEDEPVARRSYRVPALLAAVAALVLLGWGLSRRRAPAPPAPVALQAPLPMPTLAPTAVPTAQPQRADLSQSFSEDELPVELPPLTPMPAGYHPVPAP